MKKTLISLLAIAAVLTSAILPAAASEPAAPEEKPVLIYEETFERGDEANHAAVLSALGWVEQTKAMGAYTDPSAKLALADGRLEVTGASDTYFLLLDEEDMAAYAGQTITIQYDMEYTTSSDSSRYFCVLGNYAGKKYNSFHFRINGSANNQTHYDGNWLTYDSYRAETDANATARDDGAGTSIAMKLLGVKYNGERLFSTIPVTVRYVLDPEAGTAVYMKLAEDPESAFVLVSLHDEASQGAPVYDTWEANAVCLKIGGTQNGYIDHIAVWTGDGDYPKPEPEVVETEAPPAQTQEPSENTDPSTEDENIPAPTEPEVTREPQTIVNKLAIWAVAIFGGWIIVKKGKEEKDA